MKKNNFIILGNTGFVGKNLHSYLIQKKKNYKIFGFGSKKIDLSKEKKAIKLKKYINEKSIILFLSFNKTQRNASIKDLEKNLNIIKNFNKVINIKKPKKIIFFSTQSVYGEDTNNLNTTEKTLPDPTSYYGIAKYLAERLLKKKSEEKKIPLLIARIPRVYGVGDSIKNYGPSMFLDNFAKEKNFSIWGNGEEKRDYININDLNNIIYKIAKNSYTGVLNVCSGKSYSFQEIIKILEKISNKSIKIVRKKRTRKPVHHIMNNSLLKKKIGNYKFSSLEKNLNKLYNYYKFNEKY
jgi:UDP-glucose 4-epimerase